MVTLVILDGFGYSEKVEGNAIKLQGTPYLDKLNEYPHTLIKASGIAVGLTEGQMGNSEVGHLNLGAGRIVYQDMLRISNAIQDKSIMKNEALLKTINHVKKNDSALHLMGLVSDGGVHSHIEHLKALVDMASTCGVKNVFIHVITDGRDTFIKSGVNFIKDLEDDILGKAKIADICGRFYAMDRENRFDRVKKAYDLYVNGVANIKNDNAVFAVEQSYEKGVYDEFIEPTIIVENANIKEGDGVIFFNYRTDRAREITEAITQKNFNAFKTKEYNNLSYCCMTEYSADFTGVEIAFKPEKIIDNLSAIISRNKMKQYHVTETTKYAHVTFFFNGGIEDSYEGEDRVLIETANVKNLAEIPEMRAKEITANAINAISSGKYDFVLVNLSNPDMIGHTGDLDATKKAIEVVDKCAYDLAMATLNVGGQAIVTADHGNAEEMIDDQGKIVTSHTCNLVPLWLVSDKHKRVELIDNGKLANVAPTILEMLNIEKSEEMAESMIKRD